MKICYVHSAPLTDGRANSIQVLAMCHAFIENGHHVTLVIPHSIEADGKSSPANLKKKYSIHKDLELIFYKRIKILNRLSVLGVYFGVKRAIKNIDADLFITRNPLVLKMLISKNKPVAFESHNSRLNHSSPIFDRLWQKQVVKNANNKNFKSFITISDNLRKYWLSKGINENKLIALHDGFDPEMFTDVVDKNKARSELNLPPNKKIVTYTGSLYPDRDIEKLIDLAQKFSNTLFVVVGGPNDNASHYRNIANKKSIENIRFTGLVDHKKIPTYLYASDVLLAFWSDKVPTINYCSPLKLFEYLASGRVILAHDFPTIREVIEDGVNGILCNPHDEKEIYEKLEEVLETEKLSHLEKNARETAFKKYSWDKRAKEIISFINKA